MAPLDELFNTQARARAERSGADEKDVFLVFETKGGTYAISVVCVREIVDTFVLAPYPERIPGHLGIVSLRGKIFPVLAPRLCGGLDDCSLCSRHLKDMKLLVIECELNSGFCLPVLKVRKVLVERDEGKTDAQGRVLNIQGRPVRVIAVADLSNTSEVA